MFTIRSSMRGLNGSRDSWKNEDWPKIKSKKFAGTGTRFINSKGKKAIKELFERSFKK